MSDINDLTDEQLDAAFNDAAAEADSELSLSNFSSDDEHEGREPSQHDDLPEDDSDSDLSNQVQPQQQVSAPPRPAVQQADAPAWINSIADNATREQALSDWTRLRHSEASQKGRVASLNRKWSEAQELLKQREQGQAAGDNTAAQDDKLAQIAEDFPALAESLQALMEQKDKQWNKSSTATLNHCKPWSSSDTSRPYMSRAHWLQRSTPIGLALQEAMASPIGLMAPHTVPPCLTRMMPLQPSSCWTYTKPSMDFSINLNPIRNPHSVNAAAAN